MDDLCFFFLITQGKLQPTDSFFFRVFKWAENNGAYLYGQMRLNLVIHDWGEAIPDLN